MIETTYEQFATNPEDYFRISQDDRVLVLRNGKPLAILMGVENKDEEDCALQTSLEFWQMIRDRRAETGVSLEEAEKQLFGDSKGENKGASKQV